MSHDRYGVRGPLILAETEQSPAWALAPCSAFSLLRFAPETPLFLHPEIHLLQTGLSRDFESGLGNDGMSDASASLRRDEKTDGTA